MLNGIRYQLLTSKDKIVFVNLLEKSIQKLMVFERKKK